MVELRSRYAGRDALCAAGSGSQSDNATSETDLQNDTSWPALADDTPVTVHTASDVDAESDGEPTSVLPPPEATFPPAAPFLGSARTTGSMPSGPRSLDQSDYSGPHAHPAVGGRNLAATPCLAPMHEAGNTPPAPAQLRPQISYGVGQTCDAETAVVGMLRRLVCTYEGAMPRHRVCALLRQFLQMLQRFASSNAAAGPQEQYAPALHLTGGTGGVTVRQRRRPWRLWRCGGRRCGP